MFRIEKKKMAVGAVVGEKKKVCGKGKK